MTLHAGGWDDAVQEVLRFCGGFKGEQGKIIRDRSNVRRGVERLYDLSECGPVDNKFHCNLSPKSIYNHFVHLIRHGSRRPIVICDV